MPSWVTGAVLCAMRLGAGPDSRGLPAHIDCRRIHTDLQEAMAMTTTLNETDQLGAGGGQPATKVHTEPALTLSERLRPTRWTQDTTLGPAMVTAMQSTLRFGGYDADFRAFRMNERIPGFQVVIQDAHLEEHLAEFTVATSGFTMSLYSGQTANEEVALDVDSFSLDDTDCGPQRLAAVLANLENGVDSRIREEVAVHCPAVVTASVDACGLLEVHPGAATMVARIGAEGGLEADLFDDDGQLVATGAGAGMDPQYANGFADLDEFWTARDGATVYDLVRMSGRPE